MLTDTAIVAVANAIFEKPSPWVAEAYSEYDREPLLFSSGKEVASYVRSIVAQPRGLAFLFVVYPDMNGRPVRRKIHLDPNHVPGHRHRYTWDGLGLISVQLSQEPNRSRIAANSQVRAERWSPTYPDWDGPDTWNWKAIESHKRRLQRVLKKYL